MSEQRGFVVGGREGGGGVGVASIFRIVEQKSLQKSPCRHTCRAQREGQEHKVPGEPASTESDTLKAEAATH